MSEITIIYNINKKGEEYEEYKKNIIIFGSKFVNRYKNKYKMKLDNKEYEISEKYNIENYKNNKLEIKLKRINNIADISNMFYGCKSFFSLPDISKWNTNNINSVTHIFIKCPNIIISKVISSNFK